MITQDRRGPGEGKGGRGEFYLLNLTIFKLGIFVTGICVGPDQRSAVWDNLPVLVGVRGSHHEVTLPGQTLDIRSSQLYTISSSLSSVSGISN